MEKGTIPLKKVKTKAYTDQNPGTSGLRKRVNVFMQENYLENFVQSIFDCIEPAERVNKLLVLSGDGRYYNLEAIQKIIRVAAGNGVGKVVIGQNGLLSTPAVSAVIRELNNRKKKPEEECFGGIILTASHNPGGVNGDFGIKFNTKNGGPSLEAFTNMMFEKSKVISEYSMAEVSKDPVAIDKVGDISFGKVEGFTHDFHVEIIDPTEIYFNLLKKLFNFDTIKKFLHRKDFKLVFDGLSGVAGIYAKTLFLKDFGLTPDSLVGCDPKPDFAGGHPDPNLTYAKQLVSIMGMNPEKVPASIPDFGAACDGDADRNMILGKKFFVTPSDSLGVIAANYKVMPYLAGGLKGLARSMPTSKALDMVAKKLGMEYKEVPTGWKFFGNLMDAGKLSICGEESFGTGSDHIREKDGLWAILAWLSILAEYNKDTPEGKLVTVEAIVKKHWDIYGRNYYCRYDYENLETEPANKIFELLHNNLAVFEKAHQGNKAEDFEYVDLIDKSVSKHQGYIFTYADGSRFVFRKSGTGTVGATIRIYLEKYSADKLDMDTTVALKDIIADALKYSQIHEISKRDKPTVIT